VNTDSRETDRLHPMLPKINATRRKVLQCCFITIGILAIDAAMPPSKTGEWVLQALILAAAIAFIAARKPKNL
jgi:hypothetical protein